MKYIKTKVNLPQAVALTDVTYRIQTLLVDTVLAPNAF